MLTRGAPRLFLAPWLTSFRHWTGACTNIALTQQRESLVGYNHYLDITGPDARYRSLHDFFHIEGGGPGTTSWADK